MSLRDILLNLPEVASPSQKHLSFKEKLKWTGIVLVLFFVLGLVPLFGLGQNALQRFELLSIILGASFGSIISLGIGPLVTASIVLQLLNGSGILKFDLQNKDDRQTFQGLQKVFALFFVIFEAIIYVLMGGLAPPAALAGTSAFGVLEAALIVQLVVGGILIMFMDEVVSKWGFGSGISLFIAAGVSQSVFIRALSPLPSPNNPGISTGAIPAFFQSLQAGDPTGAILLLASVLATVAVFVIAVYMQAMKIEIPLSFGRVRGQGIRWPLSFNYTSNIPVILVSALFANVNLWAQLLQQKGWPLLGTLVNGVPSSGLVRWISPINLIEKLLTGSVLGTDLIQSGVYLLALVVGCVVFSYLWVQTAGMDAKSQAQQIMNSGLQIPGFRRDERVLERILERYIGPITIMGGISIGLLAGLADLGGSLTNGTALLLTVMIIYRLYEDIARQHMMDMNPMLRKFMTK
ncbi:MAG: preprotein translocase subunit SecY [Candidatus Woesearchaeota archaeon]|jgi:preprotein translocase subunit SecY|nr:preprotein translocase subunit SecY [Candidatus Woesearchaeota archaeon]MDP7198869.1 preprotein translocase subunit SecY [Candidatus Woesearchaeota archaeon]MDP7467131.1 preprotein translocase subunit SecY [Candidatus Woesearchaeota archaeon]MDP7647534.1 preprotein translocase subunit SecY [Candidatus Woesearchaeota archaeon]